VYNIGDIVSNQLKINNIGLVVFRYFTAKILYIVHLTVGYKTQGKYEIQMCCHYINKNNLVTYACLVFE